MRSRSFAIALFATLGFTLRLSAQAVAGKVVGDSTHRALVGVKVQLFGTGAKSPVDSAITDTAGVFYLTAAGAGTYWLAFIRSDAVPRGTPRWQLSADEFKQAMFVLPEGLERTAYHQLDVDKQVSTVPGNPAPRYPTAMRARSRAGATRIRFIVDTTGFLLPSSASVMFTTAPEFADAVLAALPNLKFVPAELAGQKVRQVVCMPFTFTAERSDNRVVDSLFELWHREKGCPRR